ncbi:fatty acid synthase-like [Leptopilina heterotoma]|uniref:fatty acid synthase-like n=1 Tax=Leptopilina heterotoma TaxID=63436 RepID=UPI001CA7F50F|nr:fatty acid synthase-like [Leptopilina heterotoma]
MESTISGDEIVISGIGGRFPNSDNFNELQNNLLNKIDCVGDCNMRWDSDQHNVPHCIGTIKNIHNFDRVFFGIHGKLVDCLDPMVKLIIATSYEAITDAGINPRNLKGSKTAVFSGSSFSESEKTIFCDNHSKNEYGIQGIVRAFLANRTSFFFGLTGPSVNVDSNCCGGATALQEGFMAIKTGRAENAIVASSNIILHPETSLQLSLLGLLSPDGITKTFDNEADGYTRSEAIVVYFLQKARDAKRIYAEVKNVLTGFASNSIDQSLLYPNCDSQVDLMKRTLKECGLSGKDISYVEADGSGIKDVDAEEVRAIDQVYNEGRKSPLTIGSIKSNIGSCSAVNPLNGIIKVITAMESGYIPPNLHFKTPSDKIPALKEGRCKVVTELTPWTGDYAVVNNLALSGVCSNIILKDFKKEKKNRGKPDDSLPRLVIASGCTEHAVDFLLSDLESRPVDVEILQLMYDVFETETPAHLYRGYTILPPRELLTNKTRKIQNCSGEKKEIWYMFSGMGSQWAGMGVALLQIPVFAKAIEKCDRVLKPRGIDIQRIISEEDPKTFDNIVNSFVGIAAIQIGLVDVLDSVGLKPDFLIGHSVGELGCAYADGCFTAEQMVLAALSRGLASVETEMPRGSMAAVGLGYEEIKNLCPPDIDVACHNSSSSSTISGPEKSMNAFVKQLQEKNIFAKEVACSNIAYHSRYIAPAGEKLKKYLQDVIPNPKPRSNLWLSSSVPRDEWNSARARLSSAEYHTNNFLNSVLFAETLKCISPNAVVIEIAPHGLLQAIVRKSLPDDVIVVPLAKRNHPDNVSFLLGALGNIYNAGCILKVSNLYPKVEYPVSRGTPSLSSLIQWDQPNTLGTNVQKRKPKFRKGQMNFLVNLNDDNWKFLNHAKIQGIPVIPISLYLNTAWDIVKGFQNSSEFSIVYRNVIIHEQLVEIPVDGNIELVTMVQKGSGYFQVLNNNILLCTGILEVTTEQDYVQSHQDNTVSHDLSENEIYAELEMRGLQYSGPFRLISKSSINSTTGCLVWKDNWTTFLDGMIQMYVFGNDTRKAQVPIKIRKIFIDMKLHKEITNKSKEIPITVQKRLGNICAGGVHMKGVVLETILNDSSEPKIIIKEILPGRVLGTFEHIPLSCNLHQVSNYQAGQMKSFDLNSISWIETPPTKDENKVKVEYSSVNAEDNLLINTKTSLEDSGRNGLGINSFGQEYSGINCEGNRLMGIVRNNAVSNYITPDNHFTWIIPDNWTLEDAVTVPLAHTTAYLALIIKGKLKNNESVFIYNGACSIGQAIIKLALDMNSVLFVGCNSDDDKNFLKKVYPKISDNHFIQSTKNFKNQLFFLTKTRDINLVIYNNDDLNNLEDYFILVKSCGRIVVIGNLQGSHLNSIGMLPFNENVTMLSVIPKKILNYDLETKKKLSNMMVRGISSQIVKPLPKRVYSGKMLKNDFIDTASEDVRYKIIFKLQPVDGGKTAPRFFCRTKGCYLILHGLNYFGLDLIEFLVLRGAKNIFIANETKNTNAVVEHRLKMWRESGVNVIVHQELDFTHYQNGNTLLEEVKKLGSVDAIFDLQRLDNSLRTCSNMKYLFTKNLFDESKLMYPNLRHFVVFSTCIDISESIDDILLREIDLTKIFQPKSKEKVGLLILLGPVFGIVESTSENEKNVPLLTNTIIIKQMDNLLGSNGAIISITPNPSEASLKKRQNTNIAYEESERSKFENYITGGQSLTS